MNILVLHGLGDPRRWRESMARHELCLPMSAPEHSYVVHDVALPLPSFVRDIEFDGIVLNQTFLGRRRDPSEFARVREEYSFIRDSTAFKIALPQDEYDCCAILDEWLVEWRVDLTYPACHEHWDVLFPTFSKQGRLRQGYTGYIATAAIKEWSNPKPHAQRSIDVSYRSLKIMPEYGRIGQVKGSIGDRFAKAARGRGLRLDISTDPRDTILGARWGRFLEDSRFALGANTGSSIINPRGIISKRVREFLFDNPKATFEEVEAACFPGEDGRFVLSAISPRNIECGLILTGQLLTPGSYGGILKPGEHYIELQSDMSNVQTVFAQMEDRDAVSRMIVACKDQLLATPQLRYDHHVAELLEEIANAGRGAASSRRDKASFERYRAQIAGVERWHWPKARAIARVKDALIAMGARRAKQVLMRRLSK
jgi:hypothetical protein